MFSTSLLFYKQAYTVDYFSMNELQQIWDRALLDIELSVSQATYSMWFKEVNVLRQEDGTVFLAVPNNFVQEWLYKKFHNTILRSFRQANTSIRSLEYIITKETEDKKLGESKKIGTSTDDCYATARILHQQGE